jgi:hypothetical protein
VKIKTINVIVSHNFGDTEIHAYFISDNLPAATINESVSEAYDKFRRSIEEGVKSSNLLRDLTEEEMAAAMENEYWESRFGTVVELKRSEV